MTQPRALLAGLHVSLPVLQEPEGPAGCSSRFRLGVDSEMEAADTTGEVARESPEGLEGLGDSSNTEGLEEGDGELGEGREGVASAAGSALVEFRGVAGGVLLVVLNAGRGVSGTCHQTYGRYSQYTAHIRNDLARRWAKCTMVLLPHQNQLKAVA